MEKYGLKRLFALVLLPLNYILVAWAKAHPTALEINYSEGFYPIISSSINILTAFLQFSLAEILIVVAFFLIVFYIISVIVKIINLPRGKKLVELYKFVVNIVCAAVVLSFLYTALYGINIYRPSFATKAGFNISPSTLDSLYAATAATAAEANAARENLSEDENGVFVLSGALHGAEGYLELSRLNMNELAVDYDFLSGFYLQPKPLGLSNLLSMARLTEIFFPFTYEAGINTDIPGCLQPAAMERGLANLRGYVSEGDANFIAWLVCRVSRHPEFKYSGSVLALEYLLPALKDADRSKYDEAFALLSDKVKTDLDANSAYWENFGGKPLDIGNYALKKNSEDAYIFGGFIDIFLAYRRSGKL
ncbi:MAG: DUF3810 domain-containing protein [Oscillospiraceae bacterium]|nr:DUF3810 domain-containing protein [Oscillospiraceae bacterium]